MSPKNDGLPPPWSVQILETYCCSSCGEVLALQTYAISTVTPRRTEPSDPFFGADVVCLNLECDSPRPLIETEKAADSLIEAIAAVWKKLQETKEARHEIPLQL